MNERERALVLAALRFLQSKHPAEIPQEIEDIATANGKFGRWTAKSIDKLCQSLKGHFG